MRDPSCEGIHLTKKYAREEFIPTDLQWEVAEITDDFTLYDLFCLVRRAENITPGIAATFGMSEFETFWDQINLDRDSDDIDDLKCLELYWHPSYDVRLTQKTGKPTDQKTIIPLRDNKVNHWDNPRKCELSSLMSFHGIGPGCPSKGLDFHECGDDCPKSTTYAVEFSPVNNLAHLPVRIFPIVNFYPPYIESDRIFKRTGFQLKIDPTLWCFITSIFWELTFVGSTPNTIADKAQELHDRIDECKDHLGDIS